MQEERRHTPRKIASQIIRATDLNTGRELGRVVNLNSEGIMLLAASPVESNLVYQLELRLNTPHQGHGSLQLGVESMWCSSANEPGHYWAGFRTIDISLTTIELIESLISSWETDRQTH